MTPTLKDIAERLSLSTATVSRALNGRPGVAPAVRQRVLEVARDLTLAQSPADRYPFPASAPAPAAIAFVVLRPALPGQSDAFYGPAVIGAERELAPYGYHLVAASVDEQQIVDARNMPWLGVGHVDGLLLAMPDASGRTISALVGSGLPTVLLGDVRAHAWLDSVTADDREGGYAATKHLAEHGHQHIACLSGPEEQSVIGSRGQGYGDAIRECGLEPYILYGPSSAAAVGFDLMNEALQLWPETSAAFVTTDAMAMGAYRAIAEAGRKIPDDMAIVGYDDVPWAAYADPPATTVRIHKEILGTLAARRLLEVLRGGRDVPVHIQVSNDLLIRSSCGCKAATGVDPAAD